MPTSKQLEKLTSFADSGPNDLDAPAQETMDFADADLKAAMHIFKNELAPAEGTPFTAYQRIYERTAKKTQQAYSQLGRALKSGDKQAARSASQDMDRAFRDHVNNLNNIVNLINNDDIDMAFMFQDSLSRLMMEL